jgi:hypothetical protein
MQIKEMPRMEEEGNLNADLEWMISRLASK